MMVCILIGQIFFILGVLFFTYGVSSELEKRVENKTGETLSAYKIEGSKDHLGREFHAIGYVKGGKI